MSDAVLGVVQAHIAAFNNADLDAVLATFSEDAVFRTAEQVVEGRPALAALFGQAFAPGVRATMELRNAVTQGDTAACELYETITFQGHDAAFRMAAFYTVRDGQLTRVTVYRDLPPALDD